MRRGLRETYRNFAAEVADFVDAHWPAAARRRPDAVALGHWRKVLAARGWQAPAWPVAYGGAGWPVAQRVIWERALALAEVPQPASFAVDWVGPLIYTYSARRHRAAYLDGILSGRHCWADGLDGLSLADERLRGQRRRAGYRLEGCLTGILGLSPRTTHVACTASLDDAGPSILLVDLAAGGVRRNDGCALTFANAQAELIGSAGQGLLIMQAVLLGPQAPAAPLAVAERQLEKLRQALHDSPDGVGGRLMDDARRKRQLAELEVRLTALQALAARSLTKRMGGGPLGVEAVLAQLGGAQLRAAIDAALTEVAGYYTLPQPDALLMDNEGPLTPAYAQSASQGMLDGCALAVRPWADAALRLGLSEQLRSS